MSDVFISYAREDLVFVRRLCETLRNQDREVWVDLDGVYAGEEFWPIICSGIEDADTFAFVISYHSIDSEYCRKELEHARKHNKRIVPLIHHEVNSEKIPPPADSIQWIFFREQDDFDDSIKMLTKALSTDLDWVRTHTRLLVRAREGEKKRRIKRIRVMSYGEVTSRALKSGWHKQRIMSRSQHYSRRNTLLPAAKSQLGD